MRIMSMATSCLSLRGKQFDKTNILNEVQMDFKRTMNQIVMDTFMAESPEKSKDMIPHGLTMPPKQNSKPVPYFAQETIPAHDFAT